MRFDDKELDFIHEKLWEKHVKRLDVLGITQVLHIAKEMKMDEPADQEDEYLDAFVALGGNYNKEGNIEIKMLKEIIKDDFELTINMNDYLNQVDSDNKSLDFY